ncbi:MAG: hypothetical protein ACFE95_05975 [Candidatus Hodarchaeota archaeon]
MIKEPNGNGIKLFLTLGPNHVKFVALVQIEARGKIAIAPPTINKNPEIFGLAVIKKPAIIPRNIMIADNPKNIPEISNVELPKFPG